jgi:hypothetical protein
MGSFYLVYCIYRACAYPFHQATYVIRVWVDLASNQIYLVDLIFYLRLWPCGATAALPSSTVICDLSGNWVWDDRVTYDLD